MLATRYNKLPSEVVCVGDTFDMLVFDVATTYQKFLEKKNNKDLNVNDYDPEKIKELGQKFYGKG